MVQFDNQYRQIKIKVVYYGPALGGKTTCLQHVHRVTDPQRRTKLYSLNTASDRTLFFDLMSLNLGRIRGYRLAMQLYTVPGQVQYNATRRAVLSGADGVVFVADSQASQREANRESLANLWENLEANGLDRESVPLVLQLNKRDLEPSIPIDDMEADLNEGSNRSFPTMAITGDGVMEGFVAISELTLAAVADKLGVGSSPQAVERLQQQVRAALEPFVPDEDATPAGDDVEVVRPSHELAPGQVLSQDMLVGEAVRANLEMTDLNAQMDTLRQQLERKVNGLAGITDFARDASVEHDPSGVLRTLLKSTSRLLRVQAAAVLVVPGSGQLREAVIHGFTKDPLLATPDEAGESLAIGLVTGREPILIARDLGDQRESYLMDAVEAAGFGSAVAVPLVAQDRLVGMLTAYAAANRRSLDEDDLQVAAVLSAAAAMGYTNAVAWRRLEEVNRGLEGQVSDRTRELETSLEEVQRLATDLSSKNALIEDAYRELSELDQVKNELIARISHELKTPVTSLLTAAKILDRSAVEMPEKGARFVAIIREEAEKLSEIIQSVFQASVLTAGDREPTRSPVPVEELFKRAVGPLRDLAQTREVKMHVLIPSGLAAVSCEPETMEVALRAVIRNAIEFNQKGGDVKVEVRRTTRDATPWLLLTVADSGIGIPEHEQAHVFDTFWQGGNVLSGKPRGVGLGLAIARRVVRNHGGEINLASEMGKGTTVTIELPQES